MRRWRDRHAHRSKRAWDEDKAAARRFVDEQPESVKGELAATIDELARLGETVEPLRSRVEALLARVDELVEDGVGEDVYRLAVVDAAVEYLK